MLTEVPYSDMQTLKFKANLTICTFPMNKVTDIQSEKDKMEWNKIFKHFELDEIVITFTERSVARVIVA